MDNCEVMAQEEGPASVDIEPPEGEDRHLAPVESEPVTFSEGDNFSTFEELLIHTRKNISLIFGG